MTHPTVLTHLVINCLFWFSVCHRQTTHLRVMMLVSICSLIYSLWLSYFRFMCACAGTILEHQNQKVPILFIFNIRIIGLILYWTLTLSFKVVQKNPIGISINFTASHWVAFPTFTFKLPAYEFCMMKKYFKIILQ